ncbi:hypothetical protein PENTCL1PPCAC_13410, partial [Pristionchus entomophagus]
PFQTASSSRTSVAKKRHVRISEVKTEEVEEYETRRAEVALHIRNVEYHTTARPAPVSRSAADAYHAPRKVLPPPFRVLAPASGDILSSTGVTPPPPDLPRPSFPSSTAIMPTPPPPKRVGPIPPRDPRIRPSNRSYQHTASPVFRSASNPDP